MMMMMRDGGRPSPWPLRDESPPAGMGYLLSVPDGYADALAALQRYLPSNYDDSEEMEGEREGEIPMDAYSSDEFRMYEFKVRPCARARSHDWTDCPFAHPGEKARRRDPRKFHYSGTACPDFRKGHCKRGDGCEYAHGVFECWLHPARYRTQPCKDGTACRRRVCFFAHTPEQLRVLSPRTPACGPAESYDGSPMRQSVDAYFSKFGASPTSTLISPPVSSPSDSPPLSPISPAVRRAAPGCMNEVLSSLRQLQLSKAKSVPCSWVSTVTAAGGFTSPRGVYNSLPGTPTTPTTASPATGGWVDVWERDCVGAEPMERVESGRSLRAKMFEKLAKENAVETSGEESPPDVGWVSELVK